MTERTESGALRPQRWNERQHGCLPVRNCDDSLLNVPRGVGVDLEVQMGAFEASVGATLGATWTRFLTNSQTTSCRSEMYPDYEWQSQRARAA